MRETEDYYRELYDFMMETPLVLLKDDPDDGIRGKVPETLIPVVAYYIASCPQLFEEVNQCVIDAEASDTERWKCAYQKAKSDYMVEELVYALSLDGLAAYLGVAALCLMGGETGKSLVVSLLQKAYPDSTLVTDFGGTAIFYLDQCGFDSFDAGAMYLALMSQGLRSPSGRKWEQNGESVILHFCNAAANNMRLPRWRVTEREPYHDKIGLLPGWVRRQAVLTHWDELDEWVLEHNQNLSQTYTQLKSGSMTMGGGIMKKIAADVVLDDSPHTEAYLDVLGISQNPAVKRRLEYNRKTSGSILQFAISCLQAFGANIEELMRTEPDSDDLSHIRGFYQAAFQTDKEPNANYLALGAILAAAARRTRFGMSAVLTAFEKAEAEEAQGAPGEEPQMAIPAAAGAAPDPEKEQLQRELEAMQEKVAALSAAQAKTEAEGNRAKARLESEIQELKSQRTALEQEIDEILSADDGQEEEPETDLLSALSPFTFAFIGGHDSWQNSMREVFPHARFIPYMDFKACYAGAFSGVDLAIISAKYNKHALTMCAKKAMPEGMPVLYVNTSNQERTMRAIAGRLRKMGMI